MFHNNYRMSSIYYFNIDPDYLSVCNDLCHKWILITMYNVMQSVENGGTFFSDEFVDTFCFISLGVLVYWLIFRRTVQFVSY